MNVGENGKSGGLGEAEEDVGAFDQAGTAETVDGSAVGLVVRGFEDVRNAKVGGDALESVGHVADVGFALDDAGSGDEEEFGLAVDAADGDGSDLKIVNHSNYREHK